MTTQELSTVIQNLFKGSNQRICIVGMLEVDHIVNTLYLSSSNVPLDFFEGLKQVVDNFIRQYDERNKSCTTN